MFIDKGLPRTAVLVSNILSNFNGFRFAFPYSGFVVHVFFCLVCHLALVDIAWLLKFLILHVKGDTLDL